MEKFLSEISINSTKFLMDASKKLISIGLILIIMKITIIISNRLINSFFSKREIGKFSIEQRRADTLSTILKSVFRYTIYFIGLMTIASLFGDITSLIAVAGVGSLAIGFGAQNLVKDVVTGFFIFLEDQFSVGDYITISSYGGIVEVMGLRTTHVRDFNGDLHIIPNGEISYVTNHSRGSMRAMVDVSISYDEDIGRALDVLKVLSERLSKENKNIVEGPYVLGVEELGDSYINIRVLAKTENMEQWAVERILRQEIKETFEKEGIKIPYPKKYIYSQS